MARPSLQRLVQLAAASSWFGIVFVLGLSALTGLGQALTGAAVFGVAATLAVLSLAVGHVVRQPGRLVVGASVLVAAVVLGISGWEVVTISAWRPGVLLLAVFSGIAMAIDALISITARGAEPDPVVPHLPPATHQG